MMRYIYNSILLILLAALAISFLRYYKVNEYAMAVEDGEKLTCSDFQKGITKYGGYCWSCPQGFENWITKTVSNPEGKKHCRKKNNYIDAIAHGKPTGLLNSTCKTKEVWYKNKACWTCPNGYKPARIKEDNSRAQCKPDSKYTYQPSIKMGKSGCSNGAWAGSFSKQCYRCPAGFSRNILTTALDHDPSDDRKACKGRISLMDSLFRQ